MESFVKRHGEAIVDTITGFDRLLFRGTLRSISYVAGLKKFLHAARILYKDFAAFAKDCTDALVAHAEQVAEAAGRPYQYLVSAASSKEDLAREIVDRDGVTGGLVCVFSAVEPCQSFDVHRNRQTRCLELVSRRRKCRFFYFYYLDREFGLMHVRVQSWFPFPVQVCLNGRAWLARQLEREGIGFVRVGNTFTSIDDASRAQALMDRLTRRQWAKTLSAFARRVNPLREGPLSVVHDYYWSVRQSEVATDVMFRDPAALAAIYPRLCSHAMTHFHTRDVMRFFARTPAGRAPREVVSHKVERTEGVRLKHWLEENSVKMYDKAGSVLRIETTINNPRRFRALREVQGKDRTRLAWRPMRKGISDLARRVEISQAVNARYLDALAVVGESTPSHTILDGVARPLRRQGRPHRALRPVCPDEARLFAAALEGKHLIDGFSNGQVRRRLFGPPPRDPTRARRRSAWVSRRLCLLRVHGLIRKVPKRRLYRVTEKGHRVMTTALLFRETDVALLETHAA
jgi:hypothetical protein